jgi:acetyl-CoA C-acetyltransferase
MSNGQMIDPRTPILVGCGQITDLIGKPSSERSNVAFCAEAAGLALADSRASIGAEALGRKIDAVAVLEFFPDISPRFASPFGRCSNPPKAVANRLGAAPRQLLYTHSGGNMPQYLVNRFAEEIASGETELALICGAELLRSTQNARKAGLKIDHTRIPAASRHASATTASASPTRRRGTSCALPSTSIRCWRTPSAAG